MLYLSIIPLIPLIFIPRGASSGRRWPTADASGTVTPALTAAFAGPVVRAAHLYEFAAIIGVFVLMITKPF